MGDHTSIIVEGITGFLNEAGIEIGGTNPWDIQVHNPVFFEKVMADKSIGLGDSYMDGDWDCDRLDMFTYKIAMKIPPKSTRKNDVAPDYNPQAPDIATEDIRDHFDLGNDFYEHWLGETMMYTCGDFRKTYDLDQAQKNKIDLIIERLDPKPGQRLYDVGCGFGGIALEIAKRFPKTEVHAVTLSRAQCDWANQKKEERNLKNAHFICDTYENTFTEDREIFDTIYTIGMMEHVGPQNYRKYMEIANRLLKPAGLHFLHCIIANNTHQRDNTWITKHIFRNGHLPSLAQLHSATEGLFIHEDSKNIGPNYDFTLLSWYKRFNDAWPKIRQLDAKYDNRFYRMWNYYLLMCAGLFRARQVNHIQMVMTKAGSGTRYMPPEFRGYLSDSPFGNAEAAMNWLR